MAAPLRGPSTRPTPTQRSFCDAAPCVDKQQLGKKKSLREARQEDELVPLSNDPQLQRWIFNITQEQKKASELQYGQLKLALEALDVRMEEMLMAVGSTQQDALCKHCGSPQDEVVRPPSGPPPRQKVESSPQTIRPPRPDIAEAPYDLSIEEGEVSMQLYTQALHRVGGDAPAAQAGPRTSPTLKGVLKHRQDPEPEPTAQNYGAPPDRPRISLDHEQVEFDPPAAVSESGRAGSKGRTNFDTMSNGTQKSPKSQTQRSQASTDFLEMRLVSKNLAQEKTFWHKHVIKRFSRCCIWWERVQEPARKGRLADVVTGSNFGSLASVVIMLNAGFTCYSTNYDMETLGRNPSTFIMTAEDCFLGFYSTELVLKLIVHRIYFFCNIDAKWNIFDAVLVVFSWFDLILTMMVSATGGTNLSFMRTLRILKMAKILRGIRVIKIFAELRMMLNSLAGSISSLFWSILMLILIFYLFGLVFVQGVTNWLLEMEAEPDDPQYAEIFTEFGRVERAMLTLYKASTGGDDWSLYLVTLTEAGPMYAALFIFFIAFSHIALLNILTAIFVQNAMKLAQPDKETQAMESLTTELQEYEEMQAIMRSFDTNESGTLSLSEFSRNCKAGKLGVHLAGLGLNIKDTQLFFEMVAETVGDNQGEVLIKDFVDNCMQMRGAATCIDLHYLAREVLHIQRSTMEAHNELKDLLYMLANALQNQSPAKSGGEHIEMSRC